MDAPFASLLADAQCGDHCAVAVDVLRLEVVEEATATTDELEQPTSGVEVLLVGLKMSGQVFDSFGQDRNLMALYLTPNAAIGKLWAGIGRGLP